MPARLEISKHETYEDLKPAAAAGVYFFFAASLISIQ
jgi:hypothetical protein